jgi:hypothetical protein
MDVKDQGHMIESLFDYEVMKRLKLVTAIPRSDNLPFDRIVINGKQMVRVQIKSTSKEYVDDRQRSNKTCYRFNTSNTINKKAYTEDDCDFICCYVMPMDRWYIFPVDVISVRNVRVYPEDEHHLNEYKESWALLKNFIS